MSQPTAVKSPTTRRRWIAGGCFGLIALVVVVISASLLTQSAGWLIILAFGLACLLWALRLPYVGNVRASPEGLDISRTLGSRHIPRSEISQITVETRVSSGRGGSYRLQTPRLHLSSGRQVWLPAYADSVYPKFDRNPGAEVLAGQLRAALGL